MNQLDTLSHITAHLSNSDLEKLYLLGLLASLSNLASNELWWQRRVELLTKESVSSLVSDNWRRTYNILERELSGSVPSLWNTEDDQIASYILVSTGCLLNHQYLVQAARYGSYKILSFLVCCMSQEDKEYALPDVLPHAAEEGHWYCVNCLLLCYEFSQGELEQSLLAASLARWEDQIDEYVMIVRALLERVNYVPSRALLCAVEYSDNVEIVSLLLPRIRSVSPNIPITMLRESRYAAMSLLLEAGLSPQDYLSEAVVTKNWRTIEFMLEKVGSCTIRREIAVDILLVWYCNQEVRCLDLLLTRREVREIVHREQLHRVASRECLELLEASISGEL